MVPSSFSQRNAQSHACVRWVLTLNGSQHIQPTSASQNLPQTLSSIDSQALSKQHVPCMEDADWSLLDDFETVAAERATPANGMEQPMLREHVAVLTVATKEAFQLVPQAF